MQQPEETPDGAECARLEISRFDRAQDNRPKRAVTTLAALMEAQLLAVNAEAFFAMSKDERAAVKRELAAWSPALFVEGGARRKENVEAISALVLDVDNDLDATPELIVARMQEFGWAGAAHTSISDTGEAPRRFRVVILLARALQPDEHCRIRDAAARALDVEFDPATRTDHARLYYVPVALRGMEPFVRIVEGAPLDPDALRVADQGAGVHAEAGRAESALSPARPADDAAGYSVTAPPADAPAERLGGGAEAGADDPGKPKGTDKRRFLSALEWLLTHDPKGAPCERGGFAAAGYDRWFRLACTIAHGLGKGEAGWLAFDGASRRAPQDYDENAARKLWKSIGEARRDAIYWTWATAKAAALGWKFDYSEASGDSELQFAERLAASWRGRFAVVMPAEKLMYRDERGVWREDERKARAHGEYKAALASRMATLAESDPAAAVRLGKRFGTVRVSEQVVKAACREAETCRLDDLDSDAELLGVANGVLHLKQRQLLSPAELMARGAYVTRCARATWQEGARAPRWEQFISEICVGDADLARYLQELVGSSLWGSARRRHVVAAYGAGANGKTVFQKTIGSLLNDYEGGISKRALMARAAAGSENYEMAELAGKRFVWCSETDAGDTLAAAAIKQLSGGERAQVRAIYSKPTEITPRFTLWLFTNHKPRVNDTSEGFWDRLRLVPFEARFTDKDADPRLAEKLEAERDGILAWAVEGFTRWAERGEKFEEPERVCRATAEYRQDSDTLGMWLSDCAALVPGDKSLRASSAALHASFCAWCGTENLAAWSKKRLIQALKERGAVPYQTAKERGLLGVALVGDEEAKASANVREIERTAATRAIVGLRVVP